MQIKNTTAAAALLLALAPFGFANSVSKPMGGLAYLEVSAGVSGSGNNISSVSAEVIAPSGGRTTTQAAPNSANYYNANFKTLNLSEFGTYTVITRATATGPGGSTDAAPQTATVSTFNPYQDQTLSLQFIPAPSVPPGWLRPGAINSGQYRVYQYNAPASYSAGTNNRYAGQTVTLPVPQAVAQIEAAKPGSILVKVTETGPSGTASRTVAISGGAWSYTFRNL